MSRVHFSDPDLAIPQPVPHRHPSGARWPAYFARIAAATTGSGHGTARIDTTHPILRPEKGEGDRIGTLARYAPKITDHAQRVVTHQYLTSGDAHSGPE